MDSRLRRNDDFYGARPGTYAFNGRNPDEAQRNPRATYDHAPRLSLPDCGSKKAARQLQSGGKQPRGALSKSFV